MSLNVKLKHFQPIEEAGLKARVRKYPAMTETRISGDGIKFKLFSNVLRSAFQAIDLFTVLRDHLRPGILLVPTSKKCYSLVDIGKSRPPKNIAEGKPTSTKGRGAKLLYLSPNATPSYFVVQMKRAWHFLNNDIAVEIHVKARGKNGRLICDNEARKAGKASYQGQELGQFDWKTKENLAKLDLSPADLLHLRPDVIMKTMPEGISFAITPVANFEEYAWVLSPPTRPAKDKVKYLLRLAAENPGADRQDRKAWKTAIKEQLQDSAASEESVPWNPLALSKRAEQLQNSVASEESVPWKPTALSKRPLPDQKEKRIVKDPTHLAADEPGGAKQIRIRGGVPIQRLESSKERYLGKIQSRIGSRG